MYFSIFKIKSEFYAIFAMSVNTYHVLNIVHCRFLILNDSIIVKCRLYLYSSKLFFYFKTQYNAIFRQHTVISPFFFRLYGPRCAGCLEGISPSELVRKARDKVYHVKCFSCQMCRSVQSRVS